MNLQLSLKRQWFEMTKSGIKTEDYREITPYFCNKFLLFEGEKKPRAFWRTVLNWIPVLEILDNPSVASKPFEFNIMTDAYPSKDDLDRICTLEHKGIEIRTGNPEWGAEKGKVYFVIKHGEKL